MGQLRSKSIRSYYSRYPYYVGKFEVILADPPWDIHMDLPYGTMNDDEMKQLRIKEL